MCLEIAKSGKNVLFPNLAHSGVARNGNGVCPRIPKSGNNVLFLYLALSMELPGMAKGGNVAICFQIWLFPIPKSGNNVLFPNLALSMELPRMPKIGNVYVSLELPGMTMVCAQEFPKVAIKLIYYKEKRK